MESKRKNMGTDSIKTEVVDNLSAGAGAAESMRVAVSQSQKVSELLWSSDENRKKKKKSKSKPLKEKTDDKTFSGSFADYMTHLQESKEERDQRKLNDKLKKAEALKAKKKAELDSALSFIDGKLMSCADLSDDEEETAENFKSEMRESSPDWASRVMWGEIRGQEQMSDSVEAPLTVSSTRRGEYKAEHVSENIPGEKVHIKVNMEEDTEDRDSRVTQDMCSTSVSTESKPAKLKIERVQDVSKKKLRLFVQSGGRKFQVSLEGHKKVKKLRVAVAGQLHVETHRIELQVILKYYSDSEFLSLVDAR